VDPRKRVLPCDDEEHAEIDIIATSTMTPQKSRYVPRKNEAERHCDRQPEPDDTGTAPGPPARGARPGGDVAPVIRAAEVEREHARRTVEEDGVGNFAAPLVLVENIGRS
jgi:hypothetical protein